LLVLHLFSTYQSMASTAFTLANPLEPMTLAFSGAHGPQHAIRAMRGSQTAAIASKPATDIAQYSTSVGHSGVALIAAACTAAGCRRQQRTRRQCAAHAVAELATTTIEKDSAPEGRVRLSHRSGASCEISLYGAHILSWCPEPGDERLFLGSMAQVGVPGVSIRGGVPLCWPQFGQFKEASNPPDLPHGFARKSSQWKVAKQSEDSVTLQLADDEGTRAMWPFPFQFLYKISLGDRTMRVSMEITNNGNEPMEFTGCLHTYWSCNSSQSCYVEGLQGASFDKYIGDSFRGDAVEERAAVPFSDEKETQLLYTKTSDVITLIEEGGRSLRLTKSNMPDWVLWNTGAENGSNIKDLDMANSEYQRYVCVEPGFTSKPIHVAPGTTWVASHETEALQ